MPESETVLSGGETSARAGQMWANSDCDEFDLGFIPGKNHAPPLPISLGTAEVGGAYRKPSSSVKSQSALPAVRTGRVVVLMGAPPGRQGACAASRGSRASATCNRGV